MYIASVLGLPCCARFNCAWAGKVENRVEHAKQGRPGTKATMYIHMYLPSCIRVAYILLCMHVLYVFMFALSIHRVILMSIFSVLCAWFFLYMYVCMLSLSAVIPGATSKVYQGTLKCRSDSNTYSLYCQVSLRDYPNELPMVSSTTRVTVVCGEQ